MKPVLETQNEWLRDSGTLQTSSIAIVSRELCANAIAHGNDSNREKPTRCELRKMSDGTFRILVEDEGVGFDPELIDMALPEHPRHIGNRGLKLVRALSKTLVFNATRGQVIAYVNPDRPGGDSHQDLEGVSREHAALANEFYRLADYALGCARRYERKASLVLAGSGNGPIRYNEVIRPLLRESDAFIAREDYGAVFMSETDGNAALQAVNRYETTIDESHDVRFAVASFPGEGETIDELIASAHERLELERRTE